MVQLLLADESELQQLRRCSNLVDVTGDIALKGQVHAYACLHSHARLHTQRSIAALHMDAQNI